jgi:hypothetical protein
LSGQKKAGIREGDKQSQQYKPEQQRGQQAGQGGQQGSGKQDDLSQTDKPGLDRDKR